MVKKCGRRFVRRADPTSPRMTMLLFGVLVSIPIISLYIGYLIGQHLSGPRRKFLEEGVVKEHTLLNRTLKNTHFVTPDFTGGLGNLLFEYASMYGIAKANDMLPLIPEENYLSTMFPFLASATSKEYHPGSGWSTFHERSATSFDWRAFSLNYEKNIQLEGFFQSWRYFEHMKFDIRKHFVFAEDLQKGADDFLQDAFINKLNSKGSPLQNKNQVNFIGIHIRRRDMLDSFNVEKGYRVASRAYIERAMEHFSKKYDNIIFVVCSDDPKWSRQAVTSQTHPVVFSTHGTAGFDMCLLSRCNHTIITVGTFGWWGAWLAGGEVVYYKNSLAQGSRLYYSFSPNDYYYPLWKPL